MKRSLIIHFQEIISPKLHISSKIADQAHQY